MMGLIAASPRMRRTLRPLLWMLGIEASLIQPPPPPSPVVETEDTCVAQESTDAALVGPSYPPDGEVSAVVPDGQALNPEVFART
jgi:hypothetical protein